MVVVQSPPPASPGFKRLWLRNIFYLVPNGNRLLDCHIMQPPYRFKLTIIIRGAGYERL